MLHTTYRRILHSTGRLLLTVLAVALGVTFLTGALVLADSTRAGLHDSYAQVYDGMDVVVRGPQRVDGGPFGAGSTSVPAAALDQVRSVPGVAGAEGGIRGPAQLLVAGQEGAAAVAVAAPSATTSGSLDVRTGELPDAAGEIAVDAVVAEQLDLALGDSARVLLADGPIEARIVGTVGFGRLDALAGGPRVVLDRSTAASLLGDEAYAEIAVVAERGITAATLRDRVAARLGEDAQVVTADAAGRSDATTAARAAGGVSQILFAVAGVALLVGGVLIANTFRMLVGQRVRELALLRAVGASRRQVAGSVLLEAAVTGLVGSVVGVAVGIGAGIVLVEVSAGLLPGLPPVPATVTPRAVLFGLAVGTGLAALAGRSAARRAVAVPPVAAMRWSAELDRRPSRGRSMVGAVMLALGSVGIAGGLTGDQQLRVLIGTAAVLLGAALTVPVAGSRLLSVLSRPLTRLGFTGTLARQQVLASPRRTATTAGALAISLALITLLLTVSASLDAASSTMITSRQHAELTIRSTAQQGLHDFLFDATSAVEQLEEVATARVVTYGTFTVDGADAAFYAVDPSAVSRLLDVSDRTGSVSGVRPGEVAVRAELATERGWDVGDEVRASFADGQSRDLTVAATFDGEVTTDWIVAPQTVQPHVTAADRQAFVKLADGTAPARARNAIEAVLEPHPAAEVLDRSEQQAEIADANEGTLGILTALFALSLVIGVLSVVNTLTLAIVERVRELGLLRAVGATRRQIRSIIRWEAVLTSLLGGLLGTTVGLGLAWVASAALDEQLPMPFTVPVMPLALALVGTGLLGVLAALVPAARAARLDVLRAIQTT